MSPPEGPRPGTSPVVLVTTVVFLTIGFGLDRQAASSLFPTPPGGGGVNPMRVVGAAVVGASAS